MSEEASCPMESRIKAALLQLSGRPGTAPVKKCTGADSLKMPSM